jgi:Fe-S-cluster containining protein
MTQHQLDATPVSTCQQCGACCAFFRVSFYWAEATQRGLPESCIEPVTAHLAGMAGTDRPVPRCCALQGEIGRQVTCLVYAARPSPCRELQPGDDKCNRARARHGLPPLPQQTTADTLHDDAKLSREPG